MTPNDLRAWRHAKGWTQQQAADWFGCLPRSWQRYESAERPIPAPLVARLRSQGDR